MRKLIFLMLLVAGTAQAQDFRSERLPSDRERPDYVLGTSLQRWSGGQVNWYYNPANQPANLSGAAVLNAIQVAAARWAGMCNITFNYLGTTAALPDLYGDASMVDQVNVFGWGPLLGSDAAYSAVTKSWWISASLVDTDVVMNTAQSWTITDVEAIMTHEIGHVIGLSHSDQYASVMFANPYHSVNYMRTLRGDDAQGCAMLYGAASTADSNRVFNWAESAYAQYLSPAPAVSGSISGYYYRYYPGTNSYVGTKDSRAYYMSPDGVIHDMGLLLLLTSSARSAGY